jgi:DNA-binding NtrC family response regulator
MDRRKTGRVSGTSGSSAHASQRARRRRVAAERRVKASRVLVCECDPAARPATGDAVRDLGYEVVATHTLADALRELAESGFDVLVVSLPTLDEERTSLMQLLRRAEPRVPIVMVTSDGSLRMRARAQESRPYYVAVRPVTVEELRTVLAGAVTARETRD